MEVQIVSSFTPKDRLSHFLKCFLSLEASTLIMCLAVFLLSLEYHQVFRVAFPEYFL